MKTLPVSVSEGPRPFRRSSAGRSISQAEQPLPDASPFHSLLGPYLSSHRKLLTIPETIEVLHRGRTFVIELISSGDLDAHSVGPEREKDRKLITLASVARYLAITALYEERDAYARLRDLFATFSPAQRRWAIDELTALDRPKSSFGR